jgi:hypothetical protein
MNTTINTATTFTHSDELFFRLVQSLFPPAFVFGAGVLLSSYDDEEPPYVPTEQERAEAPLSVRV